MKRKLGAVAALTVVGAVFSAPIPTWSQNPVALVVVDVHAVALGYRASELIHRPVYNDRNEEIGSIDDLIVGRDKVLFAIVGVGGFLGLGQHLIAAPYTRLVVNPQRIVLPGASRQALQALPEFHYLH